MTTSVLVGWHETRRGDFLLKPLDSSLTVTPDFPSLFLDPHDFQTYFCAIVARSGKGGIKFPSGGDRGQKLQSIGVKGR